MGEIVLTRAHLGDVEAMKALLDEHARAGDLLARSRLALYECVRDFVVAKDGAELVGLAALHVCWIDLGEIRSLAVRRDSQSQGIGRQLVERCLEDGRALGLKRAFALTYKERFFQSLGFHRVDKTELPHKVWQDCIQCVKFPDCDEIAVLKDLLP